jgi:hypothetical protein
MKMQKTKEIITEEIKSHKEFIGSLKSEISTNKIITEKQLDYIINLRMKIKEDEEIISKYEKEIMEMYGDIEIIDKMIIEKPKEINNEAEKKK